MEDRLYQEAFYGKSHTLQEAENTLASLIELIKENPLADYTNHKLNIRFCKLLAKQFGYKNVFLKWNRTPRIQANAYTYFSVDVVSDSIKNFTKVDNKGLYDKNHTHTAFIVASATMVLQCGLTADEMLGIILHEIGHNFDKSIYASFTVLFGILQMIEYALFPYKAVLNTDGMSPEEIEKVKNTIRKMKITRPLETGSWIIKNTNPGKQLFLTLDSLVEKIKDIVPGLKNLSFKIKQVVDVLYRGLEYLLTPLIFLQLPTRILMSPLTHLYTLPTRKMEEFADSFAASYGYGAAVSSGLNKLMGTNIILYDKNQKLTGLRATIADLAMCQRYMLSVFADGTHGSNDTRMVSMIEMLKKDLVRSDYPKEVKKDIAKQIVELEKVYNDYLSLDPDVGQGIITQTVRKFINELFKGRSDFIAKILPENTVNRYENTTVDSQYFDVVDLIIEKVDNGEITLQESYDLFDESFKRFSKYKTLE